MKVEAALSHYQQSAPAEPPRPLVRRPEGQVAAMTAAKDRNAGDKTPPPEQVEQAVKQINDYLQTVQRNLEFSVDKDTHQVVVKVRDAKTGEVVRQIPPKSVLEMAKAMKESKEEGLLFAQRA